MYDKRNIIIMAKLAVYDETLSDKDYHKNQYFRHDYIYRQNMWVRFFVLIGSFILIMFYILHLIAIEEKDIFDMVITGEYKKELVGFAIFIIGIQVFYSIIGTIIYTASYEKAQRRIEKYFSLVKELERRTVVRKRLLEKKRALEKDTALESDTKPDRPTVSTPIEDFDVSPMSTKPLPPKRRVQNSEPEDRLIYRKPE